MAARNRTAPPDGAHHGATADSGPPPSILHAPPLRGCAGQIAVLDTVSGGRAYLGLRQGRVARPAWVREPRPLRALQESVAIVQALGTRGRGCVSSESGTPSRRERPSPTPALPRDCAAPCRNMGARDVHVGRHGRRRAQGRRKREPGPGSRRPRGDRKPEGEDRARLRLRGRRGTRRGHASVRARRSRPTSTSLPVSTEQDRSNGASGARQLLPRRPDAGGGRRASQARSGMQVRIGWNSALRRAETRSRASNSSAIGWWRYSVPEPHQLPRVIAERWPLVRATSREFPGSGVARGRTVRAD